MQSVRNKLDISQVKPFTVAMKGEWDRLNGMGKYIRAEDYKDYRTAWKVRRGVISGMKNSDENESIRET